MVSLCLYACVYFPLKQGEDPPPPHLLSHFFAEIKFKREISGIFSGGKNAFLCSQILKIEYGSHGVGRKSMCCFFLPLFGCIQDGSRQPPLYGRTAFPAVLPLELTVCGSPWLKGLLWLLARCCFIHSCLVPLPVSKSQLSVDATFLHLLLWENCNMKQAILESIWGCYSDKRPKIWWCGVLGQLFTLVGG